MKTAAEIHNESHSMFELLNQSSFKPSITEILCMFVAIGIVMIPLEYYFSTRKGSKPTRSSTLLNIMYWFFNPMLIRPFTNLFLGLSLVGLSLAIGHNDSTSILQGFGPITKQPVWLQIIEILLFADLIEYWVHRGFHKSRFWKIHAVHHSPTSMNWLASARMHPLNDLTTKICQVVPLVAVGFPITSAALVVPYLFLYVIFLHSDTDFDFGPFKYVLVSPAYHHWHHSSESQALDKNFAGIFPIWDILFGTFYFPKERATKYGVINESPPENLFGQMTYPFKKS